MEEQRLGKILQHERKKRGITQTKLAEMTGFTIRAISYWESGDRELSIANAIKIFQSMGIKIKIILEDENVCNKQNKSGVKIDALYYPPEKGE